MIFTFQSVMFVSVGFIAATIVVYIWLPELRNLHGKCLLCYMICLAIGYVGLACVQLQLVDGPPLCEPVGYIIYAGFLSAFFWSSVIGFDLWSTFW